MRIVFTAQALRPSGAYTCTAPTIYVAAYGNTKEEIMQSAYFECSRLGADKDTLIATGLHNNRADWETIFGPVDERLKHGFLDSNDDPHR